MQKSNFIAPEIQKYTDEHSLQLNEFQKKLHEHSMNTGR